MTRSPNQPLVMWTPLWERWSAILRRVSTTLAKHRPVPPLYLLLMLLLGCGTGPAPTETPRAPSAGQTRPAGPTAESVRPIAFQRPEPRPSSYVGSTACRPCHEQICDKYAAHPMGRSAATIASALPIEGDSPTPVTAIGGFEYLSQSRDNGMVHTERLRAPGGEVAYEKSISQLFAVGSGQRGRSYLFADEKLLTMSPLTWYSGRGAWDLSPGYGELNRHFERTVSDGCIQCHFGRVAANDLPEHHFTPPYFSEVAIGCERCHGPGKAHIDYHLALQQTAQSAQLDEARRQEVRRDDPIVNPASLNPAQRESVCNQCHLQGGERVLNYGCREYDFRPGDDLSSTWIVFMRGDGVDERGATHAVSHVQQMHASACFRNSQGALGCISCHDPHETPAPEQRVSHYRERCTACHSAAKGPQCVLPEPTRRLTSAEDSCIDCHMPRLQANDVPHTAQTDHRIVRQPNKLPTKQAEAPYRPFAVPEGQISSDALQRAEGILMSRIAEQLSDLWLAEQATQQLLRLNLAEDDVPAWQALATAHNLQNQAAAAVAIWERLLARNPDDAQSLRQLAFLAHDAGNLGQAEPLLARLVALQPQDRLAAGRYIHVLGQRGQWNTAIPLAEHVLQRHPWDSRVRGWIVDAYKLSGDHAAARQHQQIYESLNRQ